MEEAEVETSIIGLSGLPFKLEVVGIRTIENTLVIDTGNGIASMDALGVDCIRLEVGVVSDTILLSGLTPSESELQFIEPVGILQECFLIDFPS